MSDLVKHFIAGALISTVVLIIVLLIAGTDKTGTDWAIGLSNLAALTAGIGKEILDRYNGGNVGAEDITLTWSGAAVPMVVWGIIQNFI